VTSQAAENDSYASLRLIVSRQRTADVRLRSPIFARLASEIFLSSLQSSFQPPAIEVARKFAEENLSFSKRSLNNFDNNPPLKKGDRGGFEFSLARNHSP
jgi:hypothetical protein